MAKSKSTDREFFIQMTIHGVFERRITATDFNEAFEVAKTMSVGEFIKEYDECLDATGRVTAVIELGPTQ